MSKLKCVLVGLLAAVGLAAIGAGVLAQQTPQAGDQAVSKPLRVAEGDRPWIRTLPNGATIEVIGVSTHPSGPQTWWGPEGSPLAQPLCDPSATDLAKAGTSIFGGKSIYRAVVVRVSNLPPDSKHGLWMRQSRGWYEPATRDGKIVPGLSVVISEHPKDLAASALHFEVATGPWQVVEAWDGRNPGTRPAHGSVPNSLWGRAIATKKGTTLTVTHDIEGTAVRLVAVDRKGEEHPSPERGGSRLKGFTQLEGEFDLSPEEIQEYRLQQRHFEQIDIPNIALEPTTTE